MTSYRIALLAGALLFGMAGGARAAGEINIVRDLAGRVGPVIGSAQACRDIATSAHPGHRRQVLAGDPGSLDERGGTFRPHAGVRSQRGRRSHRGHVGPDGLRPRRPPACRSRTVDRRTKPVQRHRSLQRRRRNRSASGNRADGRRSAGPDRPLPARHHRTGNPVRNRSPVLRLRQGTGTADEARDRHRLQSRQRCRRHRWPDAQAVCRRRRLRAVAHASKP